MTVIEGQETEDRYGRYPLILKGYKDIREVYQHLFYNYNGGKFVAIFDCTKDEIDPELSTSKDLHIYFAEDALDEICRYKYDISEKELYQAYERLKKVEAE